MFTGGTARLRLHNRGAAPLELTVEPWADAYRILPGRSCVVVTHVPAEDGSRSGTSAGASFEVDHRPDAVTVWPYGDCFHLIDEAGHEIDCADRDCPARGPVVGEGRARKDGPAVFGTTSQE
ncbi:hypothetical protein [Kitasatospora sp. NPDC088346]|uniref:hypothetical protein n=1 Tax=Kitasatospora sp. NPDC088346 TaxID=3364073 RepID=UPI00381B91F7